MSNNTWVHCHISGPSEKNFPQVFCTFNPKFIIYKYMGANKPLFLIKMSCLFDGRTEIVG